MIFVEVAGLALGQGEQPGHLATREQRDPHPTRLGRTIRWEAPVGVGADVGNQNRCAGLQDTVDDRVVGRLELRSILGREGNHAVAVEDGPDGDPRRLLDEHDAGTVEGDQPSQAVEQGRQHGFAVQAAREHQGRLA